MKASAAVIAQQQVARLHVAVQDADVVQCAERRGHLPQVAERGRPFEPRLACATAGRRRRNTPWRGRRDRRRRRGRRCARCSDDCRCATSSYSRRKRSKVVLPSTTSGTCRKILSTRCWPVRMSSARNTLDEPPTARRRRQRWPRIRTEPNLSGGACSSAAREVSASTLCAARAPCAARSTTARARTPCAAARRSRRRRGRCTITSVDAGWREIDDGRKRRARLRGRQAIRGRAHPALRDRAARRRRPSP